MARQLKVIDKELVEKAEQALNEFKDAKVITKLKAIIAAGAHPLDQVASVLQTTNRSIFRWANAFRHSGVSGLRDRPKGHNPPKLSDQQQEQLYQWITTGANADGVPTHWTIKKLQAEIKARFALTIGKTPLWLWMRRRNLALRRPRPVHAKADKDQQETFKKKLKNLYEQYLATEEPWMLMFFDEGRFGLQSSLTRRWTEKGKPLTIKVQQGYKNFYIYSGVSPKTGDSFSLFLPAVNTEMMSLYLTQLATQYPDRKVVLVMDQAGWHKAKELLIPESIQIEFLPPYSPELNPTEHLWRWLKKEVVHNRLFQKLDQLTDELVHEFQRLTPMDLARLCGCDYL